MRIVEEGVLFVNITPSVNRLDLVQSPLYILEPRNGFVVFDRRVRYLCFADVRSAQRSKVGRSRVENRPVRKVVVVHVKHEEQEFVGWTHL